MSPTERPDSCPEPDVILDVRFEAGLLFVSVRNIGAKPAINVSVTFKKKLVGLEGTKLISELALFRRLAFLAPQTEIETFLDSSASYFKRRQPARIDALVRFEDVSGIKYERRISHDLSIYKEIGYLVRVNH